MFKGLRTKIESEQKGQSDNKPKRGTRPVVDKSSESHNKAQNQPDILLNNESNTALSNSDASRVLDHGDNVSTNISHEIFPKDNLQSKSTISSSSNSKSSDTVTQQTLSFKESSAKQPCVENIIELKSQIAKLTEQLRTVIRERDEISLQKEQSDKHSRALEKKLEQNEAKYANLETKFNEYELKPKDYKAEQSSRLNNGAVNSISSYTKAFDPKRHAANISDTSISDNVEVLRDEIIELQAQLAKKNRQLKIRQQNMTDMKKALQKEILDHGKTQDELTKLRKQLIPEESIITCDDRNTAITTITNKQTFDEPNRNDSNDSLNLETRVQHHEISGDMKRAEDGRQISTVHTASTMAEDAVSLHASLGGAVAQFDRLSCLSRSSASVDDLESNDLQHSNNNNSNSKEVSHEYLRNVLFRYMTSTDTETTQHLVKAISVLVDFTPEQSAAIKSSMHNRMSSWLRLK